MNDNEFRKTWPREIFATGETRGARFHWGFVLLVNNDVHKIAITLLSLTMKYSSPSIFISS